MQYFIMTKDSSPASVSKLKQVQEQLITPSISSAIPETISEAVPGTLSEKAPESIPEKVATTTHRAIHPLFGFARQCLSSWHKLHGNQKIYALAITLLLVFGDEVTDSDEQRLMFIGCIALIGMMRELWTIFTRIWDSMFGKTVVLLIYAIIANLTLALAAQKINLIVGVAPSKLIYTQGLTTLMLFPFWLLLLSFLALTVIFIGEQLRRLFFGVLRLLRVHNTPKEEREHLPKLFLLIRMILLPVVVITLLHALDWYSDKIHMENLPINVSGFVVGKEKPGLPVSDKTPAAVILETAETAEANQEVDLPEEINSEVVGNGSLTAFDRVIAAFVYNFETYPYSRCKMAANERVAPINETDILVALKDDSELGYKFSSRLCELK